MKSKTQIRLILAILFLSTLKLFAQPESLDSITYDKSNQKLKLNLMNPEGQEFWLCFMQNYKSQDGESNSLILDLFITSETDAVVDIEIKALNFKKKVKVPGRTVQNVKLPAAAELRSSEIIEPGMSVHITSNAPISVYGLNRRFQTTDTFLGLPTKVLGTAYRIMSYTMSSPLMPEFAIVATEDNTVVYITPSVETIGGNKAQVPFSVQLNKGDAYQVIAKIEYSAGKKIDFTGSLVTSNKPISVYGGHQCAYVPTPPPVVTACNHLVEQIPPLSSWGKHFFIGKLKKRSKYTWRVLANLDSTKVFLNQKVIANLNAGQFFEDTSSQNIQIKSDKPILVAQYSQGFKNGDSIGDPCMILISPTQQFLKSYRFATPVNGSWNHFVNIVIPVQAISTLLLDGKKVDSNLFSIIGITRYAIGAIEIPYGTHSIQAALPFGMYSYGFGFDTDSFDAYGNMGGQSFIEYEPAKDTLAPTIEYFLADNNTVKVIFRDDREDDVGIKNIEILENNGFFEKIPKFSEGVPQIEATFSPIVNNPGHLILKVIDNALNESYLNICYQINLRTGNYEFSYTNDITTKCEVKEGWMIGGYLKPTFISHHSSFSVSGNVNNSIPLTPRELGSFKDATSSSVFLGLVATQKIADKTYISGNITLETFSGTLDSPDLSISHYKNPINGELLPFQEGRQISLTGSNFCIDVHIDYFFHPKVYGLIGFATYLNANKSINYNSKIISPSFVEYSSDELLKMQAKYPHELTSLNILNYGAIAGLGFFYPIQFNINLFLEATYTKYFANLIDDGDWSLSKFSVLVGAKFRI
jgi:hypothetical protein